MDVEKVERNEIGQPIRKRWQRFGLEGQRHHFHDFSPVIIDGEIVHEICRCGQKRKDQ